MKQPKSTLKYQGPYDLVSELRVIWKKKSYYLLKHESMIMTLR